MFSTSQGAPRHWTTAESLELGLVVAAFALLTTAVTFPLILRLGTLGYKPHIVGDAQYSIWNVAWVAHALVTSPLHVLDANIFYPYPKTLIYSEANLVAGALAVPVYVLTRNPFAAHNSVVLMSFVLSATGTYYLVRYLTHDRLAAGVSAVCFAFCPFVFGHLLHIQLLMTAGIPFSLLAFHRLTDRPSVARGAVLGLAMGLEGLACAYYAVFLVLLIGYAVLFMAVQRGQWKNTHYWQAVAVAAVVSALIVLPLFWSYLSLQHETGFSRALGEATPFSADWSSYLTSSSRTSGWIHAWLARMLTLPPYTDQLFPGMTALVFGIGGAIVGWNSGRFRSLAVLYVSIAALAFWESLGPAGGLYSVSYWLPGFSFLRAPSRFGILVVLALSVLAGISMTVLFNQLVRVRLVAVAILVGTVAELWTNVPLTRIDPISPAYTVLAAQPDGALLEMPPLGRGFAFTRTQYMINSTAHWKPLVNAYSDFIPDAFTDSLPVLAGFPDDASFALLQRDRVRYVTFDLREYRKNHVLEELEANLRRYSPYLKALYADDRIRLFEIVEYPAKR